MYLLNGFGSVQIVKGDMLCDEYFVLGNGSDLENNSISAISNSLNSLVPTSVLLLHQLLSFLANNTTTSF